MAAEPELGQVALPFEPLDRVRAPATSSLAVPTPDRSYNTRVVVAVVIAAVIGFAAPMLFVFVPMFYSIFSGEGLIRIPTTSSIAVYQGSLYWTTILPRGVLWESKKGTGEVRQVGKTSLPQYLIQAVATDTELWLFSTDSAERFDGKLDPPITTAPRFLEYQPFVYRGQPAYLGVAPSRFVLSSWDGRSFVELGDIPCDCTLVSERDVRAVATGDTLQLLVIESGNVRHRSAKLGDDVKNPTSWALVTKDAVRIEAAPLGPDSFVLAAGHDLVRGKYQIEIVRFEASKFAPLAKTSVPSSARTWNLVADPSSKIALLAYPGGIGGDLAVVEVDATGKTKTRRVSAGSNFFKLIFGAQGASMALALLISLSLASLLSRWMRAARGDEYRYADRSVVLASVIRRGIAQIIDSTLQMLPFASVAILLLAGVIDFETLISSPTGALYIIGFSLGSIVWGFGLLFVWSLLEARRGKTLGKWLLGIRTVGEDLEPCGIGRALVRNLLEYGDGMLMFSVGMAVTALTEKRQRLGDILAKTIVVRD